jgi:predicted MFS family arabinose efflux permease
VKAALGVSDGALGAALLCVAFGAMLAMPVAGWLGARHTPRLLTLTGIVFMLALPLPGFADSVPVLAGCLLLMGAGAGSMDVCMNARASRVEQGWGTAIMSSFHAAFSLGGLVGAGLVALCELLGWGARGSLLLTSALIGAAVAAHVVLDPRPELAEPRKAERGRERRTAWPSRAVAGIGTLCLLGFMCEGAVADWSGVFLRAVAGFSAPAGAAGFAAFSAAMVTARLAGDAAVRRFGPVRALRLGALLAGAGMALAIAIPLAGPVGFGLVGLGAANLAPILFSAAGRAGPAASTGVAAVATLGYGGMLLGPPVIGVLSDWIGLRFALLVLVAAMAAIWIGAARVAR